MCFSAPASFITGVGLLGIGAVTVKRARNRRELPYAAIPLLFGIQQLLEGVLWLTFSSPAPLLNTWATHLYLLFSNVLWPIYVPLAALALETEAWRRRIMIGMAYVGAAVGLYLLALLILLPVMASDAGQHISYNFNNPYEQTTIIIYGIVTSLSLIFSSHQRVAAFGVAVLVSEVVTYQFYTTWFISVWCFFAAVLSIIVLWHFQGRRSRLSTLS